MKRLTQDSNSKCHLIEEKMNQCTKIFIKEKLLCKELYDSYKQCINLEKKLNLNKFKNINYI